MIKRNWIQRYSDLPAHQDRLILVQSWDTASKGGPENDFSVGTTWCVTKGKQWYLVDVWRKRVDYPELKAAVQIRPPGFGRSAFWSRTLAPGLRSFRSCAARSPALSP